MNNTNNDNLISTINFKTVENTINSKDLCELINKIRKEEGINTELLHKNLLVKIEDELDLLDNIERAKNLAGRYKDVKGEERPCYNLPQKESLQVIASESKKVRRRLIDEIERLTIEVKQKQPTDILGIFELQLKAMREFETKNKELEKIQSEQHYDILKLQNNINRLTTDNDYMTVIAFANINGIKASNYNSSSLGRKASKICKDKNIPTGSIVDKRYGNIKTYPYDILEMCFENSLTN